MTEPDEAALRTVKMLMAFEAPASLTIEQAKFLTPIIARALMAERERAKAEERERCAKVADAMLNGIEWDDPDSTYVSGFEAAAEEIAATIRKGEHHDAD